MKKKIAVTGGIGSGKSTVANILKEMGYTVFSCDEIYKELLTDATFVKKIAAVFPMVIVNQKIDKKQLAQLIFSNEKNKELLNGITHPQIMQRLHKYINDCKDKIVFAEVPLLFEGNFQSQFDGIIVVKRSIEARKKALMQRDNLTETEAQLRINSQFDYDCATGKQLIDSVCAYLIDNKHTIGVLKKKLQEVLLKIESTI